ncbi:uncharacterized protein LOC132700953 [Cylas formicarius]|uniref:uncharacterized protein LOC132700953 n=1 Tax=Cylas formicarius TaxID=197179 RepID=UPI00295875E1|nr:uncharacterized protein LOC132700953 [Cylas formicarius]
MFYNNILETSEIPRECHKSITIPIFKKGQKTHPDNYRSITLLNTLTNLFTSILKERLKTQITIRLQMKQIHDRRHIHYQPTKRKINRIQYTSRGVFTLFLLTDVSRSQNEAALRWFLEFGSTLDAYRRKVRKQVTKLGQEHYVLDD